MTPDDLSSTLRKIPICDLGKEYLSLKTEIDETVGRVLSGGHYVLGAEGEKFERELSDYCGTRFAIGVNSGTDAIGLALRALRVGPRDEVIIPAMTFIATVEPVVLLGARPVLVDIEPQSYTLDVEAVRKKINSRTKAIIAVHLYGQSAELKTLTEISREHGVPLIEDMAQAIGAEYDGKKVGQFGLMACLSFFPTKNLGAYGDAGAVLTSDGELDTRLRALRNHGASIKYHHEEIAYNSRLDELQAAILSIKLLRLQEWNETRRRLAHEYDQRLQGLPLILPTEAPLRKHIFHLYCICSERRDALKIFLEQNGISPGVHYPKPLHLQPALESLGHRQGDFPMSERLAAQTLSLPLYPQMSSDDVGYVSDTVRRFFNG